MNPETIISYGIIIAVSSCIVTTGIIIPVGLWWFRRRANKITETLR